MADGLSAIFNAARQFGIQDPRALAAIAYAESGLNPGSIGDGGTSFGLFQLHQGGALPSWMSPQMAQDAATNANFAARQIAPMVKGLRGQAAIQAISAGFERPANVAQEVARAMAWYNAHQNLQAGGGGAPPTAMPTGGPPTGVPTGGVSPFSSPTPHNQLLSYLMQATQTAPTRGNWQSQANAQTQGLIQALMGGQQSATGTPPQAMGAMGAPGATGAPSGLPGQVAPLTGGNYVNPVPGMSFNGVDQGTDWAGAGSIRALGDAVITRISPQGSGTGWPGAGDGSTGNRGAMVTYQLTSGPHAGKYIYIAENIDPANLRVGQHVGAGTVVAHARGSFPGVEMGWAANGSGTTLASSRGAPISTPTNEGADFRAFLKTLGA